MEQVSICWAVSHGWMQNHTPGTTSGESNVTEVGEKSENIFAIWSIDKAWLLELLKTRKYITGT